MTVIEAWVPGWPKTKGSVTVQRGRRVAQSVRGSEGWATLVTATVANVIGGPALLHPIGSLRMCAVRLVFWLPYADVTQSGSGDVDKLERNILDALTKAGAYGDDVQVVHAETWKYPARPHPGPGVLIQLWPLAPEQHRDDWVLHILDRVLRK